jgi:hypothetical protein
MTTKVIVLLLSLCFSCNHGEYKTVKKNKGVAFVKSEADDNPLFKITRDTVSVNIEGRLYSALLINGKYYALYEVRDPSSTLPIRQFYVINKNGKIEKEVKLPKGILEDTYPHLSYWNKHIVINTEFYPKTFFLNILKNKFVQQAQTITLPVFEDDNWEITSVCNGEFGGTIYLKNKLTGVVTTNHAGCPGVINKLNDSFFVNISGIPDNYIAKIPSGVGKSLSTSKTIFQNDFTSNFYIATSFVSNDVLYHIYNFSHDLIDLNEKTERTVITKDSVKIGTISNGLF